MTTIEDITSAFGDYRAEWQLRDFESRFVAPPFFDSLLQYRPVFLIGGRGTGKTVALRSMTLDFAEKLRSHGLPSNSGLGVYIRFNKNQVRVFEFIRDDVLQWKAFAHYVNLLIVHEVCSLVSKWSKKAKSEAAGNIEREIELASISLGIEGCRTIDDLSSEINKKLNVLVLGINNPEKLSEITFSAPEAPVRQLVSLIAVSAERLEKDEVPMLHICLDEYENLKKWQQEIVNTYIKHAEYPLTYKVGVRMNGLYTHRTLDTADPLTTPEDYAVIDVTAHGFKEFATDVVRKRLGTMQERGSGLPVEPDLTFPQVSYEEEAEKLGAERHAARVKQEVRSMGDAASARWVDERTTGEAALIAYLSEKFNRPCIDVAVTSVNEVKKWENWKNNYGFAALFWYASGLQGKSIKKYVSGFDTILDISGGNIRYCLEIIYESLILWQRESSGDDPRYVRAKHQTHAARAVADRRLTQVEEQSANGKQIKRMVLAIGRSFGLMALKPQGSPEKNSFVLSGTIEAKTKVQKLLKTGAGHQTFVVVRRTKPTDKAETKDEEYRLHPIFCAFFEYSWRRKRRVTFDADLLLEVAQGSDPRAAIRKLSKTDEIDQAEENLPQQLLIYDSFFEGRRDD